MKEAGWAPSTGPEAPPSPLEELDETPEAEGELVPGDVPEWLREIAPSGALGGEPVEEPSSLEEEVLPWLQESQPGASDTVISWLGKQKDEVSPPVESQVVSDQGAQEELPAWMSGFNDDVEKADVPAPASDEGLPDWIQEIQGAEESPSSGVTDWLSQMGREPVSEQAEPAPAVEPDEWMQPAEEQPLAEEVAAEGLSLESPRPIEEIPDWLKEIEAQAEEKPPEFVEPEPVTPAQFAEAEEPAPQEAVPDWLKEIQAETPGEIETTIIAPEQAAPEGIPEHMDEVAGLVWLESLARKAGVPEDQLTTPEAEQPTEIPQWALETPVPPLSEKMEDAKEPSVPEWLSGEAQPEAALSSEETPDWLKSLEEAAPLAEFEPPAEEIAEQEAVPAEEIPDWLKAVESDVPVEEEPTQLAPAQAETTLAPEEMDQDTAMAWLESLAAKQLASEDQIPAPVEEAAEETAPWVLETPSMTEQPEPEMIKEPEKADVTFPDWLIEATEPEHLEEPVQPEEAVSEWLAGIEVEAAAEAAGQEPEPLEEAAQFEFVEPTAIETPAAEAAEPAVGEPQDDALAWLETLARKQGVPEEQLVTHPLKPVEEPPDWVQADAEAAATVEETRPTPISVEPEAAPAEISEPETFAEVEIEPSQPTDETLPSWLITESVLPTVSEIEEVTTPVETAPEETVPVQPEPVETAPVEVEFVQLEPVEAESAEVEPVKKLNINEATLSELEALPGIGFILAQAILNYKEEHGMFLSLEELDQVPGVGSDRIEGIKDLVEVTPSWEPTRFVEEAIPYHDEDEKILAQGRSAIAQENLSFAIDSFSALVQKKVYLAEIIEELGQVVKQRPDHLLAWQTLGDAYVRTDQLSEALAAYIKAEELLS
jgi:competence ComEA-like helix-hairpin-helix protein